MRLFGGAIAATAVLASAVLPGVAAAAPAGPPRDAERELRSKRTEYSSTWTTRDGKRVTRISGEPVRWRQGGRWQEYDFKLRAAVSGSGYVADAGPAQVTLPRLLRAGADGGSRLSSGSDTITMWLDGAAAPAAARDEIATYSNALDGVTVKLQAVASGLKEDLVLDAPTATHAFSYRLRLSQGLVAHAAGDGGVVVERGDETVFELPAPVATDAAEAPATAPSMRFTLSQRSGGDYRLGFAVDPRWFADPDRAFPVTVDPTAIVSTPRATRFCIDPARYFMQDEDVSIEGGALRSTCDTPNRPVVDIGGERLEDDTYRSYDQTSVRVTFASIAGPLATTDIVDSARLVLHEIGGDAPTTLGAGTRGASGTLLTTARVLDVADGSAIATNVTHIVSAWQENRTNSAAGMPQGAVEIAGTGALNLSDPLDEVALEACLQAATGCPATGWRTIATNAHSDETKRPFLEIVSIPRAPADSRVTTPAEGHATGRRVRLAAHGGSSVRSARFQYVAGDRRDWQDIPLSALRFVQPRSGSTAVASAEIPVATATGSGGGVDSAELFWDLQATPGAELDGSVHVRAILDETTPISGGVTRVVNFRLDRRDTQSSPTAPIGPGTVDLLTGDLTMSATDVTARAWLSDLSVSRTFHSRGTSTRDAEMFGPHWSASLDADGGRMPYKSLYNYSEVDEQDVVEWVRQPRLHRFEIVPDMPAEPECWEEDPDEDGEWEVFCDDPPASSVGGWHEFSTEEWTPVTDTIRWNYEYAQLELADGGKITFRRSTNNRGVETGWVADEERPGMLLEHSGTSWVITDEEGAKTTFTPAVANSPTYVPTQFQQPGSSQTPTMTWGVVDGQLRLTRVTAAALDASINAGRYLRFAWVNDATTGRQSRVKTIYFGRWNAAQSTAGPSEIAVASYAYDSQGRLTQVSNPRVAGGLPTSYTYDSVGRLATVTPPGEDAWRFAYRFVDGDVSPGRLKSVTRAAPGIGDATWTVVYGVPLSGRGAPADMSPSALATWAQRDDQPTDATAVFPPSQVPAETPASWTKAVVHYLNVDGYETNTLQPGGAISTIQYDANGNISNELTAANRDRALAAPDSVATAETLMTIHRYDDEGINEIWTLGPTRTIKLRDTGATVQGRTRTITEWDRGKPDSAAYNVPTFRSVVALYEDGGRSVQADVRATQYFYDATGTRPNRGWELRRPTRVVDDPDGLRLTTRYVYDTDKPLMRARFMPTQASAGALATRYWYYGVDAAGTVCPGTATDAAAWAGLLCRETTDVATGEAALPALTFRYDSDWSQTQLDETSPGSTRTTVLGYDAAGRLTSRTVTGPGVAVPAITLAYDTATGLPSTTTSAAIGTTPLRTVQRTYDALGRISTYTDATGEVTRTGYDIDGRISRRSGSSGTTTIEYDARGLATSLLDSTIGSAITGSYDGDGQLVEQTLPNGLVERTSYDAAGVARSRRYDKTGCSRACSWVEQQLVVDVQGRWVEETNGSGNRARTFGYDGVGRLARVEDVTGAGVCTTRVYAYDANGNRTSSASYPAGSGGACSTATTVRRQELSYDSADRATRSGRDAFAYDTLGRTTTVPATAIGDLLTATFYVSDRPRTLVQNGVTQTYEEDPLTRALTRVTSGATVATETNHYVNDGDRPLWATTGSGTWRRYVDGLSGELTAVSDNGGAVTYMLSDLHGDVVAEASSSSAATAPTARAQYDEFGVPQARGGRYGWLGAAKRSQELDSGVIAMGARTYVPQLGRFLQVDPIAGGSANDYDYTNQDPLNETDLDGCAPLRRRITPKISIRIPEPMWSRAIRCGAKCAFTCRVDKLVSCGATCARGSIGSCLGCLGAKCGPDAAKCMVKCMKK